MGGGVLRCQCCTRSRCFLSGLVALFATSLVCFALAISSNYILHAVIDDAVRTLMVVDSDKTEGYKRWVDTDEKHAIPFYWKMYAFNITNPEDVLKGGKPNLVEIGPFTYRKYRKRLDVTFPEDGDKYRFKNYQYFKFVADKSVGDPKTFNITTVNIPYQCVRGQVGLRWFEQLASATLASGTKSDLLTSVSVYDVVFGYDDPLLGLVHDYDPSVPGRYPGLQANMSSEAEGFASNYSEMWSGKSDLKKINQWTEWSGHKGAVALWATPKANEIRGTAGYQFHPFVEQDEVLEAFTDTTLRSVQAVSKETVTVEGMELYRFRVADNVFESAAKYPPNAAYYSFGPSGVINRTSSAQGAPLFLSKPHFLDADPWYRSRVTGLSPASREKHGTNIDVQPYLGSSLNAVERLQINVEMKPTFLLYPDVAHTMLPVMWIEQIASVKESPSLAATLRGQINTISVLVKVLFWGGYIGGGVLAVATLVGIPLFIRFRRKAGGGADGSYSRLHDPVAPRSYGTVQNHDDDVDVF